MDTKNNFITIVDELNTLGYSEEFRIKGGQLYWLEKAINYSADQFEIDHAYRFESADNSEDSSLIFAISTVKDGIKGVLIDVFDTLSSLEENLVVYKIRAAKTTLLTHEDSTSDLKFGLLPKVHKSKFNEDTRRYVLRKGFPDFPPCPFAQSFSMLGYDNQLNEYVWLTTSILKDERLQIVNYKDGLITGTF